MTHAESDPIYGATSSRSPHALSFRRWLHENGLSLVVFSLFLMTWIGQAIAGCLAHNHDERDHGRPPVGFLEYLTTGHFLESTAENWESEFLQMGVFVWLTSFLFQKGSPESNDPYEPEPQTPVTADSPWPARQGGFVLFLYQYSLSLAFFLLFVVSFVLHALGGARAFSQEQIEHGQSAVSVIEYLATSQFWFESLQNWQSEFLSIGAMVVLAIFLRQRNSPESKPVAAPHSQNE